MLSDGGLAGFGKRIAATWPRRRTAEADPANAGEAAEIRVLVIQNSTAYRQSLSEALADGVDPRIDLEFTSGLGEVAGKLAAGVFDLVVLDVERCLPAQLFWRLNPEHWDLPVAVLQSGLSSSLPGRIPRDPGDLVLLRRAMRAAIRRAGKRSDRPSGPAAERQGAGSHEDGRTSRAAAKAMGRLGDTVRDLFVGASPTRELSLF